MNFSAARRASCRFQPRTSLRYNALGKALLDPAYPFVAKCLSGSKRPLLDIGCGAGFLASYLRASGHTAPIVGLDADGQKIAAASRALEADDCDFSRRDALDLPDHCGDVVMLDVIHYFSANDQARLLEAIAARIAPGGVGLVRLTLRDKSWRFRATCIEESFVNASGWIPFRGIHFPRREELLECAGRHGLQTTLLPMWGITPFNSYMLELRHAQKS